MNADPTKKISVSILLILFFTKNDRNPDTKTSLNEK